MYDKETWHLTFISWLVMRLQYRTVSSITNIPSKYHAASLGLPGRGTCILPTSPPRLAHEDCVELNAFGNVLLDDDAAWPIAAKQCVKVQWVADATRQSCVEGRLVEIDYGGH